MIVDHKLIEAYQQAREIRFANNRTVVEAILLDNKSKVEKVFKQGGIDQELRDHLIFLVKSDRMLKVFLRFGGDMHAVGPPGNPYPLSLLYFCVSEFLDQKSKERRNKLVNLAVFLIEKGVDLDFADVSGQTSFSYCVEAGELELCKMFVEKGFVPCAKGVNGDLFIAAGRGHLDLCRYFVEELGLDIEAKGALGPDPATPLANAAIQGNIEVCKYLLGRGAKVDHGLQPLRVAAQVYKCPSVC